MAFIDAFTSPGGLRRVLWADAAAGAGMAALHLAAAAPLAEWLGMSPRLLLASGWLLLPLGGTFGVFVGLFSSQPYFDWGFKLIILCGAALALVLFVYGWRRRQRLSGKILNTCGAYL